MGDEMLNTVKAIKTALGGESGGETYGSELLNTVIEIKDLVENGGGGSALPPYTDADEGKALTIKKASPVPVETIIVPEQRVTVPRGGTATLNDVIYPFPTFEDGQEATVTVTYEETKSWTLVYRESNGTIGFFDEGRNKFLIYYNLAWQFDPGTEGFYTVSLKANVPSQPTVPKTIVPQMTLTLEEGAMAWTAMFPADSGVDFDFFANAQAGDNATFILDGQEYVSTAASYYGMILFPLGDEYLVGYASLLGGTGLAALNEPEEKTHTISGTKEVAKVEPKWGTIQSGESEVRYLAVYDEDAGMYEINATFAEINAAFGSGSKIEIYEVYNGTEHTMGYVSNISPLTATTLWLNFDDHGANETTAIALSSDAKPTFDYGTYGAGYIEFTLSGSTWSCSHTLAELNDIGVGTPVVVDLPIEGLPPNSNKMTLIPVMHMSYGEGLACEYFTKDEPFTATSNEKFDVKASVFQSNVLVTANKYSVAVTNTNLLA